MVIEERSPSRPWVKRMQFFFFGQIRFICQLFSWIDANVVRTFVCSYRRNPFASLCMKMHSSKSAFIVGPNAGILSVFALGGVSKVCNPIVKTIAIYVVNVVFWKFSINIKPRKSVSIVSVSKKTDADVFMAAACSSRFSGFYYTPSPSIVVKPRKHSGVRIVMKNFAQTFCSKIGLSHDAVLSLIGQRPGSVSALSGLRYFMANPLCLSRPM